MTKLYQFKSMEGKNHINIEFQFLENTVFLEVLLRYFGIHFLDIWHIFGMYV